MRACACVRVRVRVCACVLTRTLYADIVAFAPCPIANTKATVEVLKKHGADLSHWQKIDVYLLDVYGDVIADHSSTDRIFATNDAFRGLKAPMKQRDDGKLEPNFQTRYLTEVRVHAYACVCMCMHVCDC